MLQAAPQRSEMLRNASHGAGRLLSDDSAIFAGPSRVEWIAMFT